MTDKGLRYIKIGKHKIEKCLIDIYIDHFGADKNDIQKWDNDRKMLHNAIFEFTGLERTSKEGQEFSKALDKYCEPKIMQYDRLSAALKRMNIAETDKERKTAEFLLKMELERTKIKELTGIRDKPIISNECRICGKDIKEGMGRVNDHMACVAGFDEIDKPICCKCSEENPDEYHIAFKRQYWSKENAKEKN